MVRHRYALVDLYIARRQDKSATRALPLVSLRCQKAWLAVYSKSSYLVYRGVDPCQFIVSFGY